MRYWDSKNGRGRDSNSKNSGRDERRRGSIDEERDRACKVRRQC